MKHRVQNDKESTQPSRLRKWAALTAVPAVVAAAIMLWPQSGPAPNATVTAERAKSTARSERREAPPAAAALAYHWTAGDLLTYKVRSHNTIRLTQEGAEHDGPGNTIEIAGLCSYRVLDVSDDGVTVAAQMAETTIYGDENSQRLIEELLDAEPVILVFSPRGELLECRLRPDLPSEDRGILAGMHQHQLVLPEDPGAQTWTTIETGRSGTFECTHTLNRNGVIEKRRSSPGEDPRTGPEVVHSEIAATVGNAWLEVLDVRETFAINNGETHLGSVGTTFHMQAAAQTIEPTGIAQLFDNPAIAAAYTPSTLPGGSGCSSLAQQRLLELEERYAAMPMTEITGQLRTITESATSHAATVDAIHALRDWLLVNPGQAMALADSLADPSLPIGFTARAIHALELAARIPEAQQALAGILNRPEMFTRAQMLQAIIASGGVGEGLQPALHVALSEAINRSSSTGDYSLSDAALYALGTLAETNPQVADQLSAALLPDLADTNPPRTTQTALNALANGRLATPELVQQATHLARSYPGTAVRAAAVHYLARLPDTTPQALFPFLSDPAEKVQLEAIDSLAARQSAHPEITAALEQHLTASTSDLVTTHLEHLLQN